MQVNDDCGQLDSLDPEDTLDPQTLNEYIIYHHLADLLEGLPESGYARLEFLKNYARVLLVLDTTWSCPLLTQAFLEAQVAIREAKAQVASS